MTVQKSLAWLTRVIGRLVLVSLVPLALTLVVPPGATAQGATHVADTAASFSIVTDPVITPSFDPSVPNYAIRCTSAPFTHVTTTGTGPVVVGGKTFPGPVDLYEPLVPGQSLTITNGGNSYYIRCLPADFPTYTSEVTGTPQATGYMLNLLNYAVAFDTHGVPVWWFEAPAGDSAQNAGFIDPTTIAWADASGPQLGIRYELRGLDGTLKGYVGNPPSVPFDIHDLEVLPNGNYLGILDVTTNCPTAPTQCDFSSWGQSSQASILDNVIVELDSNNQVVWSWDVATHVNIASADTAWRASFPDVLHMNSVSYDGNGGIIWSARHLDAVYRIDMATGNITWKLGGTQTPQSLAVSSNVSGVVTSPLFSGQHDAKLDPAGDLTVHDNGTQANRPPRALRFSIDTAANTATIVEQMTDSRATSAFCCGSSTRLSTGDWVMSWGANPFMTELSPTGVPQITITYLTSAFSYRVNPVEASIADLRQGMDVMVPPLTITNDMSPPSTAMALPSNNATVGGSQYLAAGATDNVGVTHQEFHLSGPGVSGTMVIPAVPFVYGWLGGFNFGTVPNGQYQLTSVADDAAGNSATSAPFTITVQNSTDTAVVAPSSGATLQGGIWLDASAVGDQGVQSVQFTLSGGPNNLSDQIIGAPAVATVYGWLSAFDATGFPNGNYTIESVVTDTLGNLSTSAPVSVSINNPPLSTAVLTPSSGATLQGGIWLNASAAGQGGVTSVQFTLSGGPNNLSGQDIGPTAVVTPYGWLSGFDTTVFPNGTYTIQSVVSGNSGTQFTSVPVPVTINNPIFTPTIFAPSSGATVPGARHSTSLLNGSLW